MSVLYRRGRSRPLLLLLAVAAALATITAPAIASPPDRGSETQLSFECAHDEVFVGVGVEAFDDGAFLDVYVETGTGYLFAFADEVTLDGTSVAATAELIDGETGEPVGIVSVEATLSPTGPVETYSDRFRDGNRLVRFEDTVSPAATSGAIVLDGAIDLELDLAACSGQVVESSYFATNPATSVGRFGGRFLECTVEGTGVSGSLLASAFEGEGAFADLYLDEFDGRSVAGWAEDTVFDDTTLMATFMLFDTDTWEPVADASVEATLTSLGTSVDRDHSPRQTVKVTIEEFAVEGTLTIDGAPYELTACLAQDVDEQVRFTDPPRRGRPVANDLPGDAILLGVPDSDDVDTTGTAEEPEAPCTDAFDDGGEIIEFELPIAHTAWWTFEGTGGPVTVDTAGSGIDTIVGVYDADLTQLACVDDVEEPDFFSFQAAVTIDTVEGATYLVQVGGFAGDRGPVTVSLE